MAVPDNKMADTDEKIFVGKGEQPAWLTLALANRHGLVTGATGTGKTVTLQVMAEGFSPRRRPGFSPHHKGQPPRIATMGQAQDLLPKPPREMGPAWPPDQFSGLFW